MKVVLSYIHYPMAMGKWFERALRRREDVELFTVGPYTSAWIPWQGGMHLPVKYAIPPKLPLGANGNLPTVPITWVEQQLPWQPDLWLQVDAGWYLRGRPNRGKNVFIGTDPHCLNYDAQRELADTFYCMQTPYMKTGDEYLPYAYDPTIHYPEEQPQNYDVCLIGLLYQEREMLINELKRKGLRVHYLIGPVFDEYREIYCQAPIAINWSSQQDLCARVFEGLAMRRLVVANRVPDQERLFDANQLAPFDTLDEAVSWVMFYMENPRARKETTALGYEAVRPHTWDARIETILNGHH